VTSHPPMDASYFCDQSPTYGRFIFLWPVTHLCANTVFKPWNTSAIANCHYFVKTV